MTIPLILAVLLAMNLAPAQPYDVTAFGAAIVATGHGSDLHWYTPGVEHYLPHGVPSTVKGATNCWPPVYSGRVYVNHRLPADEIPATVMHELVHLHQNCHGSEWEAELASMDALAYLGRDEDVIRNLITRLQPPSGLPNAIVMEYYTRPVSRMLADDLGEYPHLRRVLVEAGVIEDEWDGKL